MGKKIIICSDGTWNTPLQTDRGRVVPSNVVRFARALVDDDEQCIFYDAGVGTDRGWWARFWGGVTGAGLEQNIYDGYQFIIEHYEPGDELFLFGFSRGAYTVRSLGGMVHRCGIIRQGAADLPAAPDRHEQPPVDEASVARQLMEQARRVFRGGNREEASRFKARYAHPDSRIAMIGVWDTVGALGIPSSWFNPRTWLLGGKGRYEFLDTGLNASVQAAYHALAIDEYRVPFQPTLWEQNPEQAAAGQVLEQVWFAGAHTNVGGGYDDPGLSDITLNWMIEKAEHHGLRFEPAAVARLYPDSLGELRDSRAGWLNKLFYRRKVARVMPERPECEDEAEEDKRQGCHVHHTVERRLRNRIMPYRPGHLPKKYWRYPA
ncbi:MAG TPA: DUF2235 domain-containing protein [Hymenobacter sp.]|uniref:DUF2235 domain-containing protein n=1 Tax=Hymenobacter sp. TaxID=1898978 RepID=UPI002EDAD981